MVSVIIAFVGGIAGLYTLAELPDPMWTALPLAGLPFLRHRPARIATAALAGFAWALFDAHATLATSLPVAHERRDLVAEGTIVGLSERLERRSRFLFDIEHLHDGTVAVQSPGRVRLSWYGKPPPLRAGDRWRLTVRLKRPHGFMNPGGFDYEGWLFQRGIRATGYVRGHDVNRRLGRTLAPRAIIDRGRHALRARLGSVLEDVGASHPGLVTALALGDRGRVTPTEWDTLVGTGTNHLLAISGLHVGLVAAMAFAAGRRVWLLWPAAAARLAAPRAAAVAAILAAMAYAALAGFAIPTQRALVMIVIFMTAWLLPRQAAPGRGLVVALGVVAAMDPRGVMSPGFWLSFGAVAVILYAVTGRLPRPTGIRGFLRVQWAVSLGLLPLLLLWFGQAPLVSPVANLFMVPLVSLAVVPLVLLGTGLVVVWPWAAGIVLNVADTLLGLGWPGLEFLAGLQPLQWQVAALPIWCLIAAGVGILWSLGPPALPGRPLGLVALVPMAVVTPLTPSTRTAQLTLLEVGQGLAAVIRTREHVVVYDTGPRFSARFDAGSAAVVPYLRRLGVDGLDMLVVGHGDNDHAGGLPAVRAAYPPDRLLAGDAADIRHSEPCRAGQAWRMDDVVFRILHPRGAGVGNDASCVLMVAAGNTRLLLPGDIEAVGERRLLARGMDTAADVVVAPHHGSDSSSGPAFVRAVSPDWVLYSTGYRNRHGFPDASVVARYADAGARALNTAEVGAVTLRLGPDGVGPVRGWREVAARFWNGR